MWKLVFVIPEKPKLPVFQKDLIVWKPQCWGNEAGINIEFQKDLIVWKPPLRSGLYNINLLFQKDLIVWKPRYAIKKTMIRRSFRRT